MKNNIKALIVLILILIGSTVTAGCGVTQVSSDIVDKTEDQSITVADEFVAVYKQSGDWLIVYRHIPTETMWVKYTSEGSFVPMGVTWDEYREASAAFHAENDIINDTEE